MIDWLWLIPACVVSFWLGAVSNRKFLNGATAGILGTILAFLWIG